MSTTWAIRTHRWKYIRYEDLTDSDEAYDLQNDPYEMNNVISHRSTPLTALRRRLDQLILEG